MWKLGELRHKISTLFFNNCWELLITSLEQYSQRFCNGPTICGKLPSSSKFTPPQNCCISLTILFTHTLLRDGTLEFMTVNPSWILGEEVCFLGVFKFTLCAPSPKVKVQLSLIWSVLCTFFGAWCVEHFIRCWLEHREAKKS